MSGKPRASGARAALDYFKVPGAEKRVAEYAQRKQEMVARLIEAGEFTAYPDALRFVIATKDAGMLIADASSSKNAALFLRKIRLDTFAQEQGISSPSLRPGLSLLDYFDADVSGRDFAHGKPDPEIFLTAAHELGVEARCAMVLEDASAGVEAAKAGGTAPISWSPRSTASTPPPSPKEGWRRGKRSGAAVFATFGPGRLSGVPAPQTAYADAPVPSPSCGLSSRPTPAIPPAIHQKKSWALTLRDQMRFTADAAYRFRGPAMSGHGDGTH